MEDDLLSRAEVLSGGLSRGRRAAKLLAAIEARCIYMRDESRRVVAAYLVEGNEDFRRRFDADLATSLKLMAAPHEPLSLNHLERFASQWKALVPTDPEVRARIIQLIERKYGLTSSTGPAALTALGDADSSVQAAYRRLYGETLPEAGDGPVGTPGQQPPLSKDAATQAWEDVETRLEWLSLAGGEILYRAGDPCDGLYVVVSGRVRTVASDEEGNQTSAGEMGRGELVGELEVLTGDARAATVQAVRDSELVRLGRDELLALAHKHLDVMVRINALIARRLRKQHVSADRTTSTTLSFALVPCDDGAPLQDFGRQLVGALAEFGPTVYLTPAVLDEAIEPGAAQASLDDPRNPQVMSWLTELESRYSYVVYEAAADLSQWSRRCIRQADRIVLIGCVGATPQPAHHERAILSEGSLAGDQPAAPERGKAYRGRPDLVLLHRPGAPAAAGTAAWLKPRSLRTHHHVRLGDRGDMASLARRLSGHAFGLVLGGGGARGFAHIGVLRALQEAGIQVDLVGGTSMGALVAGGIGLGMSWEDMRKMGARLSSPITLFDPTLPLVSLFSSRKVSKVLHNIYGDARIEDLWRPMFCVSSNLTHASETVYREGPLWKAVRASMSIPGIFSPVLHNGHLQVDGAVMNNVPTDVMRALGQAGPVVTVNVMPPVDEVKQYHVGPSLSGTRALFSMVNPYDETSAPLIYESLVRVMALHDVRQEESRRRLSDIYITPPVEEYNVLDFASYDRIIEIGYRSALEALAAYKEETGRPIEGTRAGCGSSPTLQQLDNTLSNLEMILNGSTDAE